MSPCPQSDCVRDKVPETIIKMYLLEVVGKLVEILIIWE